MERLVRLVLEVSEDLRRNLKAALASEGITVVDWFKGKAKEKIEEFENKQREKLGNKSEGQ